MAFSKTAKSAFDKFAKATLAGVATFWVASGADLIHQVTSIQSAEKVGLALAAGVATAALDAAKNLAPVALGSVKAKLAARGGKAAQAAEAVSDALTAALQ